MRMMAKVKRPLSRDSGKNPSEVVEAEVRKKPWYRTTDAELFSQRYKEVRSSMGLEKVKLEDKDREVLVEEARKRDPRMRNLLDVVFIKRDGIGRDGKFLTMPIYTSQTGERIARFLRLRTVRRIRLDEYGWSVWALIDGRKDIGQIGMRMRERFGDGVEPLYPRLSKFIAYLVHLGLIREKA